MNKGRMQKGSKFQLLSTHVYLKFLDFYKFHSVLPALIYPKIHDEQHSL